MTNILGVDIDFSGIKAKDWILSFLITFFLVVGPIIPLANLGIDISSIDMSNAFTFLILVLGTLLALVLRDRRENGSSSLQSIAIGGFMCIIIFYMVLGGMFLLNPPDAARDEVVLAYSDTYEKYEREYELIEHTANLLRAKMYQENFTEVHRLIDEADERTFTFYSHFDHVCDLASNLNVSTKEVVQLGDMGLYCFDQELYKSCYTEESATLRVFVDFISEVASKTHDDCLGLLEEIKLSEACTNVGFTGEEMYEGVSEICVLLEEQ